MDENEGVNLNTTNVFRCGQLILLKKYFHIRGKSTEGGINDLAEK